MKINQILILESDPCWSGYKRKPGTKKYEPGSCERVEEDLNEFAPTNNPSGGNYLKALASAWYNGTFNTGDLHKGIKSQEDVERLLERGIHCGDGKIRKYYIGYNSDFDGVEIQSDDHYEYADSDDAGNDIDSRTGKPWGPYDFVEFHDSDLDESVAEGETWSKHNNPRAGGMSQKSVKSYRRSHPGSKIQTAVTTKPSKLKKGSKSAKRRASFCARMRGMKKHRTGAKTARDPNSNINKSLRRWHCESVEDLQQLVMIAEQKVNEAKNWKQQAAIAVNMKNHHQKPKHVDESDDQTQSAYLQGAKDIIKGADPHHIARVRNLDPETLQKYVRLVWDKIDSKEYNFRKPDLAEVKDDDDDGLIGGRYTPEQWAKMINNLKRKAQEQDAKKKQQEEPKDLGESTDQLNKIIRLLGNKK